MGIARRRFRGVLDRRCEVPRRLASRTVCWMAAGAALLLACQVAHAQHATGYEPPVYAGSAAGTIITGQDGFYIPVTDSQDGLVYTYAGNALGLPQNPTGREQFVGVTGGDTALPVPFARAQRDMVYGAGTGVWTTSFDIAATYVGQLPSAQNIGSLSTQVFAAPNPSEQTFIALARWSDPATAANWNADYVWFDSAGTQLIESVPDPAFQLLLTNHWYRWCTTYDLDTNAIVEVSITDLTSGVTATHNPVDRYMFGGTTGSATGPPTGFRYFAGSSTAAGNTLAFDNLSVEEGQAPCVAVTQCGDCPTDGPVNGPNGSVGAEDLAYVLGNWGPLPPDADPEIVCIDNLEPLPGNGSIGAEDLAKILGTWGDCPG